MNVARSGAQPVPFGATATLITDNKTDVSSIVGEEGQLYISGMPEEGRVQVKWGKEESQQCIAQYVLSVEIKPHDLTVPYGDRGGVVIEPMLTDQWYVRADVLADITEENYMRVIYSKTARLFEAAAQCSGILAGCTPEEEKGLQDYGRYLGTAFQLIDDLLDYNADGEQLGKNVGDDLNEGKPTLPLLHAMHHGTPEQAQMIRTAIEQGNGRHLLEPVLEAMNACGSLEWTRQRAEEEADKAIAALQVLPDTPWREALIGLAHIAVQRDR